MTRTIKMAMALALLAPFVGLAPVAAVAGQHDTSGDGRSIVQIAREAGSFTTLVRALRGAGLVGTLSGQGHGEFTVFAPTDEAFAKLPAGTLESLLKDRAALRNILLYHLVAGEYFAAQVLTMPSLPTLNGQSLTIQTSGGPRVNDANIVATDIDARNGVIHVIDTVLLPQ